MQKQWKTGLFSYSSNSVVTGDKLLLGSVNLGVGAESNE